MLLKDKKAVIFGVANNKSIAYGIAKAFKDNGASIALSYPNDAIKKRVEPIAKELGADLIFPCDVSQDSEITNSAEIVKKHWGNIDVLVHAVAFANREDLQGRFIDTNRAGYATALDISSYSLVALCKAFEEIMNPGSSVMTLSYYGAQKIITHYNVMGVAKAALEACVGYLSYDLGEKDIRINAISAGPIRTLAASGIGGIALILNHMEKFTPLKRNVTIEDVGNTAVYLASDLSKSVTGEVLFVDAGYHRSGIQIEKKDEE
ncbi:enoyl-ACP reductase FabI [Desulfovibrio litoralis]|uniref:Enoyl-[acyl-carrier-protein] reductase [NADH] n=1 Tax=Desulfovibrio litoralis DSM 11393 TaxID=1121455 RepID=A0A1M7SP64_9BACT|nr:enoyl-ACP reductase [Desulfovibrio litoralis]SHN60281.1 Enoyl-[acyl-carrier-protein] reductase [NADH] [Desulfovibrio litoralis DSM 11393]